jgi:hypothetical protein
MRLLRRVDGSVLWLLANNATFVRNLRKRAQESGVEPERLVFAEWADLPEYLSRQRCADLGLDTFYYNGGTTTSDALWAGLPVVALKGTTFAGRMAADLLQAIGLPDLIAQTAAEYEELAFRLATDRELLDSLKQRLGSQPVDQLIVRYCGIRQASGGSVSDDGGKEQQGGLVVLIRLHARPRHMLALYIRHDQDSGPNHRTVQDSRPDGAARGRSAAL